MSPDEFDALSARLTGVRFVEDGISFQCPKCGEADAGFYAEGRLSCLGGCGEGEIVAAVGVTVNGNGAHPPPVKVKAQWELEAIRKAEIAEWEETLAGVGNEILRQNPNLTREQFHDALMERARDRSINGTPPPARLAMESSEIEGSVGLLVRLASKQLATVNGNASKVPARIDIPWESYALAVQANEAYLAREPVIDKLLYSSAVSMITGGKHAGKSTLARWMAICVAKGFPFLKRPVIQGPVFYIASEDEAMPARQELIRLGWGMDDPLRFFSSANMPTDDPVKFLQALAGDIKERQVSLVILDMLFDFVRIADEMSYAGTREAVGHIQDVASQTGTHLNVLHHAPKHAQVSDAAVAALGSQGLAARVSPIILVRRFGPGVHSIISTAVRDPRGQAIDESRLFRHEDGSVTLGGVWKTYMLAEAYSERVLEFIGQEEGAEVTASGVAEGLNLAYEVARACLTSLWKGGAIERAGGSGKKGKPFRYIVSTQSRENTPHIGGDVGYSEQRSKTVKPGFDEVAQDDPLSRCDMRNCAQRGEFHAGPHLLKRGYQD